MLQIIPFHLFMQKKRGIQSVEITSQNHNYAVDIGWTSRIPSKSLIEHLNDQTVSGLRLKE